MVRYGFSFSFPPRREGVKSVLESKIMVKSALSTMHVDHSTEIDSHRFRQHHGKLALLSIVSNPATEQTTNPAATFDSKECP